MRIAVASLLAFGLTACGGGSGSTPSANVTPVPVTTQTSIWFHPLPPIATYPGGPPPGSGSTDFSTLFTAGATWPTAMAHTNVIGLYGGWVTSASDADLQTMVTFLNAHNMGIELEAPALQALATCGNGVEGYVPYGQTVHDVTVAYLQRLSALGAPVTYVKADEPFFYGSVVTESTACQFPQSTVVTEFAAFAQLVKSYFPNAKVGDVEPLVTQLYQPDTVTAIGAFHDAYRAATGAPFPFFIADMDFSNAGWPSLAKSMETATHNRGIQFGIIYSGDPTDTSDAQWTGKAVTRFQAYEGAANGGRPDIALFQSWMLHPWKCLPETDPTTFTGVLDAYIAAQ